MRKRHGSAALARRARCVVLWSDGERRIDIRSKLACNDAFVSKWTAAFQAQGLAGLVSLHPGRAPKMPTAKLEARVLNRTLKHSPKDGSTHWSSRKLSAELGDVSFSAVQRIWRKHGVRPHRLETHMVSNDPDFETKAADVIGLYLQPPAHAAVFCVDEKTAIQALDRKDRMLPLAPGRAQSHGFEYKRNGTLSLFAALNTRTGQVLGKTAARHTSEQFVNFLEEIVASQYSRRQIHVICDNVSSHKTPLVQAFLDKHRRRVHMHYTPTYSSWLNQVENWFSRIQRDVITRGVFTSIKDLDKKLMCYIRQYNKDPKPLKWTFADPTRRITADFSDSVD
ncbi:IS630 family transposase [Xanthomonas cucurbitae]|uniref:IS630 family transposase n=1 Tax=Xanthomonas cucurbitae TaxID=56453 RepID=A0ABY7YEI4_9XANT|nr:IS630 family transposase [Xanthomonas cucurbitae]WDM68431.1 IS630 family transposase [Xanthomonas cucurbitae]WDM72305.1 IS630 family transposase [Xanthomonas cucurbitae]